jgi:hypothetical protein
MRERTAAGWLDEMRGTVDDEAAYATGWTISGLVTLGTIIAVWLLGI